MSDLNRAYHRTYFLVFTLLICDVVVASPANKVQPHRASIQHREILPDGTLNCETERSSDYYGLGVRLGIYFAWFQAWLANICVPSEIPLALDTNAVFLFAILVSMVRCTITGLLWQMDGLMLMHIGGGTIFSVLSIWGYRTCVFDVDGPTEGIRKFGGWGTHLRLLLCMGISTFGLFFWVWGIKGELSYDTDPGCEVVYTFMFSKVRADGGIRIFYIFICIGCMLYFGSMLLVSLVAAPTRLQRWFTAHKEGDSGQRLRHKFATGLNQKQLRQIFYFLRIGNFAFIIYSMLLIEYTLNYNHIAGVLGWRGHIFFPSQVIPMIIGAFGFCRVVWTRYLQWKSPDYMHVNTRRTILKPDLKALVRIYSPKSNASMESAKQRSDHEMDPLMVGQPIGLRLLVSWLPWLGVLRWWKSDHDDNNIGNNYTSSKYNDGWLPSPEGGYESPILTSGQWSTASTPRVGTMQQRDTWGSSATNTYTELPRIPKNIARFENTI